MAYWIAAFTFLALGAVGYRGVYLAALLVVCLPIGNAYSEYFYRYGLLVYDYYFIALAFRLIYASLKGQEALVKHNILILIGLTVVYAAISLLSVDFDKYYLRDFRLVFFALQVYLLLSVNASTLQFSAREILVFFLVAALSSLLFASAGYLGWATFEDSFYEKNSFRYFAVSSYVSVVFILASSRFPADLQRSFLYILVLFLSFAAVFATGFRFLIFVVIALFSASRMRSLSGVVVTAIGLVLLGFFLISLGENSQLLQRIGSVNEEAIVRDLASRYSPFFVKIEAFSSIDLVFGAGFGSVFEIPWFAHRESKDVFNNFVDSAYLTLYVKFGMFGFLYLLVVARSLLSIADADDVISRRIFLLFIFSIYSVYCLPYQSAAVGLMFGLLLCRRLRS